MKEIEIMRIAHECEISINDIISQYGIIDDENVYLILTEIKKWITNINNEIKHNIQERNK